MEPRISVITISYNSASTIEETIKSVVSQNYSNFEYIVIDGASTDGTQQIINRYREAISVFVSEKDSGISNAFNKGINMASGDLIALINSDDYLLPGVLRKVAETWDGKSDIWSGNYIAFNEQTGDKRRIRPSVNFPVMPFFCKPVHQGRFITKTLYNKLGGYDERIRVPMDLDFLMRADRNGASFQYEDIDVSVFRLGGATSQSIFNKKDDYVACVLNNGGNKIQAYVFYIFLIITQQFKCFFVRLGKDIIRSIRYKKV